MKNLLFTTITILGFVITANAQVTVTITANSPTTICSDNSVQLTGIVSPSGVYQYQWIKNGINITGSNVSTYTANTSGNYTLKVTDLNSSVYNSNSITVTVNSLPNAPSVTYNSPAIICNGGSITLSDNNSSNATYQWYLGNNQITNATYNTFSASTAGTYNLKITNLTTGCSNSSQNIIVGEMPKIVADTIVTCGNSKTISLTNSNLSYSTLPASCNVNMSGASIVNTTIIGSSGSQNIIVCYGGNYTNGGGSNTYVVEYGGTLNGFGGSGSCTAYIKAGGIYNYNSGGGGGNVVYYEPGAIINAGKTQTIQCSSIGVIYPSNTTSLCNNLTYQWSNGATTPTITVNPTIPTTYSVTISNGSISCTDEVLVTPSVASPTISASGPTTLCQGGSVVLTSSSSSSNTWSNGAKTQSITVTDSGTYTVTVSNGNCSVTSVPTVVTINQVPATPTISASGSTTLCQGGSVVLTSSSATGNTWSNSATTQSITITNSGSYTITVSNVNCSVTSAPTIVNVNPNPIVSLASLNAFINNNSNAITLVGTPSGGTYIGSGISGTSFNPKLAGLGNKTITYNYTNSNNCSGSATRSTIVFDTTGIVCSSTKYDTITTHISVTDTLIIKAHFAGLNNIIGTTEIKIYPNPTSDIIYINTGDFTQLSGSTIKITDALGKSVFSSLINQQLFTINTSQFGARGVYTVQIMDGNQIVKDTRKIVLQ